MCTGGGAWDNAKKYIEEGNFGAGLRATRPPSPATPSRPLQGHGGPAINWLIKIINIVARMVPLFRSEG